LSSRRPFLFARRLHVRPMIRRLCGGVFAVSTALLFGGAALAQDPVKVAPNNYKTAFENDSVRVCEVKAKPGEKVAMHSHPDHLVYAVTAAKFKLTYPDGKSKDVDVKAGEAMWIKAETHAAENTGAAELKLVVFELKKPAAGGTPSKMHDAEDQAKVSPESTKVVLDNERVRLLDVRLKGGGKLAKHSHPANVAYSLTDAKVKVSTADGKTEERNMTAGQVIWSGPTTHEVVSAGTAESHVLVVELKEQTK